MFFFAKMVKNVDQLLKFSLLFHLKSGSLKDISAHVCLSVGVAFLVID